MGAISSRILSRKKILSNATTERLSPKLQRKAEKRAEKARKKGKPHLEITPDGYLHLVTDKPDSPPKPPPISPKKGKDRGAKPSQEEASSSVATTSSRPRVQKTNPQAELTEDDSFYDEAFGLWPAEASPKPVSLPLTKEYGGKADQHSPAFLILALEQIRLRQRDLIARAAELLGVTQDQASLMLLYFRWKLDDLVEAYRLDPERVCTESGIRVNNAQLIQDPRDDEERQRMKATFKRWPRSAPVAVPGQSQANRRLSDASAQANTPSYNADASSNSARRGGPLGIDRPPTPRRPSGNRIQLQFPPVTRLVQQPADATVVEIITEDMLAPYGLDLATFNQRLASLQDIIALADTQRAVQLLLGAGGDVNIATNHFFNAELPPEEAPREPMLTDRSNSVAGSALPSQQPAEPIVFEFKALDAEIEQMIAELERGNTSYAETRKQVLQIARESIRQQDGRVALRVGDAAPIAATPRSNVEAVPSSPSTGDPQLRRLHRRDLLLRLLSGEKDKSEAEPIEAANLAPEPAAPNGVAAPATAAVAAPVPAGQGEEIEPIEPIRLEPILPKSGAGSSTAPPLTTASVTAELSASEKAVHPGETLCPVCYCWTKDDECFSLECGHVYCRDCWSGHLMAKLSDGPLCLYARCMAPKCALVVPKSAWQRLVAPASMERYENFLVKSFVTGSSDICWCSNPRSCEYAVVASDVADEPTGTALAHCRCGFVFCWGCKEERHVPITCEQLNAWLQQCSREKASGVGEWVITNAKPCPSCKAPIEKNEGCMHMTCLLCSHEFCWLCREPWSTHGEQTGGYFACNRYATSDAKLEDDDNEKRKAQLRRFLHYFERYAQHHRSKEIAAKNLDEAPARLQEYMTRHPNTPISNFFLDAAKLVQDCRGVLKNTYAFAYFLPLMETPEKRLFEYLQANLEATTEKLTELVEQPLDRVNSDMVVSYTKATRKFLENLLQGLQIGLTYNQPFVPSSPKKAAGKQRKRLGTSEDDSAPQQLPSLPEP